MLKTKEQLKAQIQHLLQQVKQDHGTWVAVCVRFNFCLTSAYETKLRKNIVKGLFEQLLVDPISKAYKVVEISPEIFVFFAHDAQIHSIEHVQSHYYDNLSDKGMAVGCYDLTVDFERLEKELQDDVDLYAKEEKTKEVIHELNPMMLEEMAANGGMELLQEQRALRKEPHVLVVDDEKLTLRILENFAKKQGVVYTASEAQAALDMYASVLPDVLLLDINLDGFSGLELLRIIRKYDQGCYVLMVSSHKQAQVVQEAVKAGAAGYLTKPFSAKQFEQAFARYLKAQK